MEKPNFRLVFVDAEDRFEVDDDGHLVWNSSTMVLERNIPAFIEWLSAERAKWDAQQETDNG